MEGSNKLKLSYIKKMMDSELTSKEFDFLVCLAMRQNSKGEIFGVYYKDICDSIQISYQEFYNVLYALEAKGLIRRCKTNLIDHDITLIDNDFSDKRSFYDGYVRLTTMFSSADFRKMKVKAKLMALECYRLADTNRSSFRKNKKDFIEDFKRLFGVQERTLRRYLKQLKKYFSVGLKDGCYYITPKENAKNYTRTSETANCQQNFVKSVCRRNKIDCNSVSGQQQVVKVAELINQYKTVLDNVQEKLAFCIRQSVELINKNNRRRKTWIRELRPKFVHKLIKMQIDLYGNDNEFGIIPEDLTLDPQ